MRRGWSMAYRGRTSYQKPSASNSAQAPSWALYVHADLGDLIRNQRTESQLRAPSPQVSSPYEIGAVAPTSTTLGNDAQPQRDCNTTTVSFPSLWVGHNAFGTSRCIAKPTIWRKATRWISPKHWLNSLEDCYHEQKHKRRTSR